MFTYRQPRLYHQFLTRPKNGVIQDSNPQEQTNNRAFIRDIVGIEDNSVRYLLFHALWEAIDQSLDHDVGNCKCCRGKEVSLATSKRFFVLTICGDPRQLSDKKWSLAL